MNNIYGDLILDLTKSVRSSFSFNKVKHSFKITFMILLCYNGDRID